jgi:diaminopimelate epimerase
MRFVKYHGCGNDFVIVSEDEGVDRSSLPELARAVCHRRLGVGADGLIVCRTDPLTMDIYNSDGSAAPMCGNGIRCFALYCIDEGVVSPDAREFDVETLAGVMRVRVDSRDGTPPDADGWRSGAFTVEVDMGRPDWSARAAGIDPALADGDEEFIGRRVNADIDGSAHGVRLSSFFLGTYHTVVWLDENEWLSCGGAGAATSLYGDEGIDRAGRVLESHPAFTERTNVDFARVTGANDAEMITWERGAGLTAACGTGACSVAALGIREGRFDGGAEVRVSLPYGELFIRQDETGEVFMRGPALRVFDGDYGGVK